MDRIDAITDILSDPAYENLHIVTIIEVGSLPNLVTLTSPLPLTTPLNLMIQYVTLSRLVPVPHHCLPTLWITHHMRAAGSRY